MKEDIEYHEEGPVDSETIDLYFGIIGSAFFFVWSLFPLLKSDGVRLWAMYIGLALLLLSFLLPKALTPFRKLWIRFGLLIQKITQPLILGIIFYVFFTPIGVLMRFFGKDPLLLKNRHDVSSYWKLRDLQSNADMNNQF